MKEFGSDFHFVNAFNTGFSRLTDYYRSALLYADGRQCLVSLLRQYSWKRIWVPEYFCQEVIETIKDQTGVYVAFYKDNPINEAVVEDLPFQDGDVLLRVNYFGIRGLRNNKKLSCPVIEDHTHDPLSDWALNSDADWCISSIRKVLPIPEGGMMWSPKGHSFIQSLGYSKENEQIAATRWEGMLMKTAFLDGQSINKDLFRKCFIETEGWFDRAEPSLIDRKTSSFVSNTFDIKLWQEARRRNWSLLRGMIDHDAFHILVPENESCTMFSMVLQFESKKQRDYFRECLISSCVYPSVLWNLPDDVSFEAKSFSDCMLSIHCDGRYSKEDIMQLAAVINKVN